MTQGSPRRLKILVIEDEDRVRRVVVDLLGALGHTVLQAEGGREGLARLEAGESVDLVLTDLSIPEMSGWEVVKAVKGRWPHIRVGLITGTPEASAEGVEMVDFVIAKPVTLAGLREGISQGPPPHQQTPGNAEEK
ncbi:MAG: response regulator [Candidatus Methylomirabilia bacterium]